MSEQYSFEREAPAEVGPERRLQRVDITIVGDRENASEQNREAFGQWLAERIVTAVEDAQRAGKRLVFDMATGSTPEAVWSALQELVKQGRVDLSDVIVIGHEEAWGTYAPGSHSDFDAYRRDRFFTRNGLPVSEMTDPEKLRQPVIEGNFLPMHLGDDPQAAAQQYGEMLEALRDRDDIVFFGLYGVGTDGHIGEMQMGAMGRDPSFQHRKSYADSVQDYSFESAAPQLFRWQDESGQFRPEDNLFWQRGHTDAGRAERENYGGMQAIIGLGWRDLLRQDRMVLAFNNEQKQLAFRLAMEGTFSGEVRDSQGQSLMHVSQERGEGEAILPELAEMGLILEERGELAAGTVDAVLTSGESLKCGRLFSEIYRALDSAGARVTDAGRPYQWLWELANRYIGKRAPVTRLLRLRSLFGRPTELVATPEVVKGTPYEVLLGRQQPENP